MTTRNYRHIPSLWRHLCAVGVLWCLAISTPLRAQEVTIRGRVIDDNREPVDLVLVHVDGTSVSTRTNNRGDYTLRCQSADSLTIIFQLLGFETRRRTLAAPRDTVQLNVMMPHIAYELGTVEVNEIRQQAGTMTDINMADTRHLGNASGQGIEQIVATQAGVSTHNELSNQYNVRGGSFDENSVYLNGIEMYRPLLIRSGQQEGLSVINPDMVERVQFSAGGFEARYGDKMSSVLDIQYKRPTRLEASASVSMLGAAAYVGYGRENKFSMMHALRYKTTKNLLGTTDTHGEYDPRDFDYQAFLSWNITPRWRIDLIGNIARNDYNFTPHDRETKFGTSEDAHEFRVYFDGWEEDKFHTWFGAATLNHQFNDYSSLSLTWSGFKTRESETYDIQGQYWLDSEDYAIGTYKEHARNRLEATVNQIGLAGKTRLGSHDLSYGLLFKHEKVDERMREWEMRDSAGYSLPHRPPRLDLIYNLTSTEGIKANRWEAYVQDKWYKTYDEGELVMSYGLRIAHWDLNRETIVSPRATISFIPAKHDEWLFRFATGLYYQAPFYKELKDTTLVNGNATVVLNHDIKSQRSIHFLVGADYKFKVDGRPFIATAEAYYKALSNLNPYNVDNVRLSYYGENIATGYAAGLDLKVYGEFVPGTDSWMSIGVMQTKEKIHGHTVPRPTDQLLNFNILFSDYFPGTDHWKVTMRGHYATGLPFGPPHTGRERQVFRMRSYKRVDLGLSYRIDVNRNATTRRWGLKDMWVGVDAFNILDVNNVNSYYWVTDITNHQFAVPNYLTGRQINLRLMVEL